MKHEGAVVSAQFSPDGQRVLTASGEYSARLWDATTGQALGKPMQPQSWVVSARFSPDGKRVLTAHGIIPTAVGRGHWPSFGPAHAARRGGEVGAV